MTLLSTATTAADNIGLRRPTTFFGSTDAEMQTLARSINRECAFLLSSAYWQQLRTERTFTAIAGSVQTSILPSDFNRMVPETFWDRSNTRLITSVASAVEWQNLKAIQYTGPEYKFVIRGGSLYIIPDMAGGESLAFEYITNNFCASAGGTAQSAFAADSDTMLFDETLVGLGATWRYLAAIKQPYSDEFQQYSAYRDQLLVNNEPTADIMLSGDIFGGGRAFGGAPSAGGMTYY